ncbi:hypothetical protein NA57DRAFT_76409 [Rhizodiscina lignyota]|uniref:Uncharacterized protein n=1 Tax=Rhizodiscina lignyota TaxID=1504668 RepID=A0A9P4IE37_9PEZI|nr:hypothetical protein NA57DRAFT_76409 [Rhizodiscina lignyota]
MNAEVSRGYHDGLRKNAMWAPDGYDYNCCWPKRAAVYNLYVQPAVTEPTARGHSATVEGTIDNTVPEDMVAAENQLEELSDAMIREAES